jgi:hypothetical protein
MLESVVTLARSGLIERWRRLSRRQRRLLARACGLLGLASAAVALLPFRIAIRFGCVPVVAKMSAGVEEVVWAVEAAGRRLPWRTACIEKGLVAQRMLRSSGFGAILHYGARHHPETGLLEAHVWVSVDGRLVLGGAEAADFAPIAVYR